MGISIFKSSFLGANFIHHILKVIRGYLNVHNFAIFADNGILKEYKIFLNIS